MRRISVSNYRKLVLWGLGIYHNIEDYIEIPLLIKSWNLDYKYYVRQHSIDDTETVFYAIRDGKDK